MYEEENNKGLVVAVAVILALVVGGAIFVVGSALMKHKSAAANAQSSSSSQSEESSESSASSQGEVIVSSSSENSSSSSASASASKTAPVYRPTTPAVKPGQSGTASSASSSSSSSSSYSSGGSTSSSSRYSSKTYSESGDYDSKQTFNNVTVKTGDITLENKVIKGDLTITSDADGTVELVNCVVEGTLYVRGGDEVILTDSRVGAVYVKKTNEDTVALRADGETRCGTVTAYTSVDLDESGLDSGYYGFRTLTVNKGYPTVDVNLIETELTTATINEETDLDLDGNSVIDNLYLKDATTIDGSGSIGTMIVRSDDIISYIVPDDEDTTSRYDDVDYRVHAPALSTPTGLALTWSDGYFHFGWTGADTHATGYEYQITASGVTTTNSTTTGTTAIVVDSFIDHATTMKVRATTTSSSYSPSAWATITVTPRQVASVSSCSITSASASGFTVSWPAAANAVSYTVAVTGSATKTFAGVTATTRALTAADLDLSELQTGSTFTVTVTAQNAAAKPAASGAADTLTVQRLATPAITSSYAGGTLTFNWGAVSGATSYAVSGTGISYTSGTTATAALPEGTAAAVTASVTASGYYNQTAKVLYLSSSAATSAVTASKLAAPAGLAYQSITSSGVTLNWTAVSNAAGYSLNYAVNGGTAQTAAAAGTVKTLSAADLGLADPTADNTAYSATVKATGDTDPSDGTIYWDSDASAAAAITVTRLTAPALTTSVAIHSTDAVITASWTAEAGVTYTASAGATLTGSQATRTFSAGNANITVTASKTNTSTNYYVPASSTTDTYTILADASGVSGASAAAPAAVSDTVTISGLTLDTTHYTYTLTASVAGTAQTPYTLTGTTFTLADVLNDDSAVPAAYTVTLEAADNAAGDVTIYLPQSKTILTVTAP